LRKGIQRLDEISPRIPAKRLAVVAGIVFAMVILAVGIHFYGKRGVVDPPTQVIDLVQVALSASVSGAHMLVDGKDVGVGPRTVPLKPGSHQIDASLAGFVSDGPVSLDVTSGKTDLSKNVDLKPLPPLFRVRTEFPGDALLDDKPLKLDGNVYETS